MSVEMYRKFKPYVDAMVTEEENQEAIPFRYPQERSLRKMQGMQSKVLLMLLDEVERLVEKQTPVSAVAPEPSLRDLQLEIGAWSARTFPASTPHSTMKHLWVEVAEVDHALENHRSNLAEETADVFILLVQLCNRLGIDLQREVMAKHAINERRTWQEPDKDGVVYHKKGE